MRWLTCSLTRDLFPLSPAYEVQSTFELYEYPGRPYPPEIRKRKDPPAPTADEVCTYLEEYINDKGMKGKFKYNTRVVNIMFTSINDWLIEFEHDFIGDHFRYVIICNGLVSSKPNMINFPGLRSFQNGGGKVMHSSQRRDNEKELLGKKVLIIGNGKSAADAAIAAATIKADNPDVEMPAPIQLARRQTWYVPRYLLGLLQYKWAFHTRIGSSLLPRYYEIRNPILVLLHFVLSPIKWLLWRVVEILLLCQYRLPARLWPSLGTVEHEALNTSVLITDERHLRRLRRGEVDMRVGEVDHVNGSKKVTLKDGTTIKNVDVIIMATGWELRFDLFMEGDCTYSGLNFGGNESLGFEKDGLWLYRNVLPPSIHGVAFVGSNTLTFMNIFTSYIQSYWLAQMLAGDRDWPTETHMKQTVEREKQFKRKYYPNCPMRGASIEAYMQHYHDVLYREMKARQPFNCLIRPIANLIVPVLPSTMAGCLEPKKKKQSDQSKKTQKKDKKAKRGSAETDLDSTDSSLPVV